MMTPKVRQYKRHRGIERTFGFRGRGRGWEDLGEGQRNMYTIIWEMKHQSMFNTGYRMLGAGARG